MTRRLSLRARLAVLTSVAVAVAVAACAVGCWFIVRGRLLGQLDQSLSGPAGGPPHDSPQAICGPPPPRDTDRLREFLPTVQVVWANGTVCSPGDTTSPLVLARSDIAVAQGRQGPTYRNGRTEDGTPMRVFTRLDRTGGGAAVSVASRSAR